MASGRVNIKNSADLEAGIDIILGVGQTIAAIRVFDSNGNLLSTYGQQPAVVTNPAAGQNVIQSSDNAVPALILKPHTNTPTSNTFRVQDANGLRVLDVEPTGVAGVSVIIQANVSADALDLSTAPGYTGTILRVSGLDGSSNIRSQTLLRALGQIFFLLQTSVLTDLEVAADITPLWITSSISGSQAGGQTFSGWDASVGPREWLRGGTNGSAPIVGFLGHAAVVQQPTASATGITGIRTDTIAHAVADIQVILTALRAWSVANGLTANTA